MSDIHKEILDLRKEDPVFNLIMKKAEKMELSLENTLFLAVKTLIHQNNALIDELANMCCEFDDRPSLHYTPTQ